MTAIAYAPRIPLHSLGYGQADVARFFTHRVNAPRIPLHSLGSMGSGPQAIQVAGSVGGKVAGQAVSSAIASSAASSGSTFFAAAAGPIGAAVAVGFALITSLLAAHAMRAKQAKDENSAVNIGVSGFDSDLKKIQQAFTSGQVDATTAIQAAQLILQNYWQLVAPVIQPGRNGCQSGGACTNDPCRAHGVGAACCVGCGALKGSIYGSIGQADSGVIAAINGTSASPKGPHVAQIEKVYSSKYGARSREAYTIDFTPPAPPATAIAAASSIEQSLGIPASSGSSMLPLLLLAGAALFVLR